MVDIVFGIFFGFSSFIFLLYLIRREINRSVEKYFDDKYPDFKRNSKF